MWSRKATKQSRKYAKKGLELFSKYYLDYLNNDFDSIKNIQLASNYSGKAINISETTAAHAMSYKITSMYGIPHGHAVAMCMNAIFNTVKVMSRYNGLDFKTLFFEVLGQTNLICFLNIPEEDKKVLLNSVNPDRLLNFPYKISVEKCYRFINRNREDH